MSDTTIAPRSLTPHLVCRDAAAAIDFYVRAFDATEEIRLPGPDGRLMHACVVINGAPVMLVDEMPEVGNLSPQHFGGTSVSLHLNVDDADAWVARANDAGAEILMEVADQFWGDRYGIVRDPFGHEWSIATPGATITDQDELQEAAASAPPMT